MIGAVIGDIAGSIYEMNPHKSKDFDFMGPGTTFTDDSVMTIAVANGIATCRDDRLDLEQQVIYYMKKIGRRYPSCGYGERFISWLFSDDDKPYNSLGNGSAMRVSAAAEVSVTLEEALDLAKRTAAITHDHPEGIKGAQAVAAAIFMAGHGSTKCDIRKYIEDNFYKLDFTLDEIRDSYTFDPTCAGTVPQAIECFLESTSTEDAVRNAVSIGGDSDTNGAMAGSIAEAFYGVPKDLRNIALSKLDGNLWTEFVEAEERIKEIRERNYKVIKCGEK